jgi:ligand-binding sensor domain-containing protein
MKIIINFLLGNFVLLVMISSCYEKSVSVTNTETVITLSNSKSKVSLSDTLNFKSGVRSILHDSKGNYWFGSDKSGVCLFDGDSFTYFKMKDGLNDHQVRRIKEDKDGTIWFGTANGVSSYVNQKIISHSALDLGILSSNQWELKESDLWFNAANSPGIYRVYDGSVQYLSFPVEDSKNREFAFGVTGVSDQREGKLWIACYSGVYGYDGNTFDIINDKYLGYNYGELHVRSILEDTKGRLWIGNNGLGVLLVEDGKTTNFSSSQNLSKGKSVGGSRSAPGTLEHVFEIGEDKYGNIWFGDRDTGAWKYDGKKVINYTVDKNLKDQHIWDIYEDRNGDLLFAMHAGGVYQYNGESFVRRF